MVTWLGEDISTKTVTARCNTWRGIAFTKGKPVPITDPMMIEGQGQSLLKVVDITKTRTQLKERAAKDLGIIEPGETLSAEDNETFDGLVDPLIAQLAADAIVYISGQRGDRG
jgi:hypothetical protein